MSARDSSKGDKSASAAREAPEDQIEITSEMIRAGVELLDRLHDPSSGRLVREVYRAMERARIRARPLGSGTPEKS
jgi:hypothetical protein